MVQKPRAKAEPAAQRLKDTGFLRCTVSRTARVPDPGVPPLPPPFDSKIFLRKDFDSNRDTELIRIDIPRIRIGPEACAHGAGSAFVSRSPRGVGVPISAKIR